jgi:hypothetical protein
VFAADEKAYPLGDAGTLHVALPEGWTGESDGNTPPTIQMKSPEGKHVSVQVTPLPVEMTDARLKEAAQAMGDHVAAGTKEKKTTLEELKGDHLHGWVSSFTDASADPGEYRYITSGAVLCDKHVMTLTVLYNDKVSKDHTAALAAVKSFSITGAGAPAPADAAAGKEIHVKSPDGTWSLLVPGHWQIRNQGKSPDGKSRQLLATSDDGKMELTLFMEPANDPKGNATVARSFYLNRMKQNPLPLEHRRVNQVGDVATVEYDQGLEGFKPHNLNAYLSHAGVWVDVHVSQNDFDATKDRKAFDDLIEGLKVE